MRKPPSFQDGMHAAKCLKNAISKRKDILVHEVILFGSVARNDVHEWSDIDIAVICEPFETSKLREVMTLYALHPERDVRISIVVLHPEDMKNKYLSIAQSVEEDGVVV